MSLNENSPVTIHAHNGTATTFVNGKPNDIQTLGSDQEGDAVIGMAVLADGTDVILSATVGLAAAKYYNYGNVPGYSSVQVTTIDNGVASTNTLSLGSPNDTSGPVNGTIKTGSQSASDFLDRASYAEDMQIVALSGGGYVIAETTVDDNIGPVNGNLYFAVFNSSGQPINSSGQVVSSPDWTRVNTVDPASNTSVEHGTQFYTNPNDHADASENDYFQIAATPTGGFAIEWGENDEINGYFQQFTSTGASASSIVNFLNLEYGVLDGAAFAVDTNGDIALAIPSSTNVYTPNSFAIYSSSDTSILSESWQAADGNLVPVISNPGHSGVDPINAEYSGEFQALPSGGFLAVVTDPTGPWNTQNGYPDVDYYLQRITVSGQTVTFDTPVLIGDNLATTPVVLSNGNILLGLTNGTTTTYEILNASELPSANTGMASSTPATLTPLAGGSLSPSGTTIVSAVSDNNGGVLAALQSGLATKYYGTLDASLYVADFNNASPLASPTLTTTASPGTVTLSTATVSLKDTAALSGGSNPTGSITFTLYKGSTLIDTETATVTGNGSYTTPTGYTLPANGTATGTYQWDASYGGDSNNHTVSDNNNPNEQDVVSKASPTLSTAPSSTTVTLGTNSVTLEDTAVLAGGYNEAGSITFTLYQGSTLVDTETTTVNGNGTYSTPTGYTLPTNSTATGTYQWDASYSGDANNNSVSDDNNANERDVVSAATPSINTSQQPAIATVGSSIADKATVSGGFNPTGTVTFNLYNNPNGTGTPLFTDANVALVNGVATSAGYTATATGTDYWIATYNGDSNNSPVTSGTALEPITVTPATPSINTSQQPASATVGSSIADKTTVTGGDNPTGTVTFNLYNNPNGTGTPLFTDANVALVNGVATSTGYTAPATGTDYWIATYNGDSNNSPVTSGTALEPVTVSAASPTLTTAPSSTTVTLGTNSVTLKDTAVLASGFNETGSITFTLYQGSTLVDTETATVNGNGTYSTPTGYTLPTNSTATGTYQWDAGYSGDANNSTVSDNNNANERDVVSKASPTLSTTPSSTTVTLGTNPVTLKDTAILAGGYNETGSITFTLHQGSTLVDTETATVNGNGTYSTPTGYTLPGSGPVAGTYSWSASYSGDGNNNSESASPEQTTVTPAAPTGLAQKGTATNGGTIEIAGTDDAEGDTIKLYNGNTLVGSGTVAANDTFDITTSATFVDGAYSITATDTSTDGTQTSAASLPVTANVFPEAPTLMQLVGQPLTGQTVELKGTGEAGDTVHLYADGNTTIVGTGTVGTGGTFDITTTATFALGQHSFTATETDGANLASAPSTAFAVDVAPNLTPANFSGDGLSGVLWRDTADETFVEWQMDGAAVTSSQLATYFGAVTTPPSSWRVAGTSDLNGDGKTDILWQSADGSLADWTMNGAVITASDYLRYQGQVVAPDSSWSIAGIGDFNGDGDADLLWRDTNGSLAEWLMNGSTIEASDTPTYQGSAVSPDSSWSVAAIGDFSGGDDADVIWRQSTTGALAEWQMNGATITSSAAITAQGVAVTPDSSWSIVGVGDFNGDGREDLLWRQSTTGSLVEWLMNGAQVAASAQVTSQGNPVTPDATWNLVEVGDFNGDGKADLLWQQNTTGSLVEWQMNGTQIVSSQTVTSQGAPIAPSNVWQVQSFPNNVV